MPRVGRAVPRILRHRLPNGLTVLLAPEPESPTASVWVWYRVGSKNEWPGVTGASHWVEHMLFQGSPRYGKGEIDRAVVQVGGSLNAFTDTDYTAYFMTVPREHLAIPLDIESDRMTRALITHEEVERERTVIRSEREGNENWPEFRVEEETYALSYTVHPYRWDALGFPRDIERMNAADLAGYYRRFYGTRNAVLVVAGGFDPRRTISDIRRRFGPLPETGEDPTVDVVEPPARGERRAVLSGPGTTPYVELGWRGPSIEDPTAPAAMVVDALLGGEAPLFSAGSGWGRGREHPTSRLYRRLVDPGLAVRARSDGRPRVHPGLFTVQAQAADGVSLDRLEEEITAAVGALARSGPTRREMSDVRTRVARGAALAYEGATRIGFRLGYFATVGPPNLEARLYERLLTVSAEQVRAEARRLFIDQPHTVVHYLPKGDRHEE